MHSHGAAGASELWHVVVLLGMAASAWVALAVSSRPARAERRRIRRS